jgi:hypothetical protein
MPRNPKIEITDRQEKYLRSNVNRMTTQEIANNLSVSYGKVQSWFIELGIQKTKVTGPKKKIVPFDLDREEFYDPKMMANFPF